MRRTFEPQCGQEIQKIEHEGNSNEPPPLAVRLSPGRRRALRSHLEVVRPCATGRGERGKFILMATSEIAKVAVHHAHSGWDRQGFLPICQGCKPSDDTKHERRSQRP